MNNQREPLSNKLESEGLYLRLPVDLFVNTMEYKYPSPHINTFIYTQTKEWIERRTMGEREMKEDRVTDRLKTAQMPRHNFR